MTGAAFSADETSAADSGKNKTEKQEVKSQTPTGGFLAEYEKDVREPSPPGAPKLFETILTLIASLLFVIGLIYVFMIILKFFYIRASIPMKAEGVVRVLAKEHLDNKKTMYVVEFGDRIILVGSGGESISALSEVTDENERAKIKDRADEYIAKYRLKNESKFSQELKSTYLKQGKSLLKTGNRTIKNMMDKLKNKDKTDEK